MINIHGLEQGNMWVGGVERTYYFHAPAGQGTQKIPLVIVLHGGEGDGVKAAEQTAFNETSDQSGFAVAYPNALGHWNDGRSTTASEYDDVQFTKRLIGRLVATKNIDRERVYATGPSNGGMMTLRLACELSDKIAAFAPVVASFPVPYYPQCSPSRRVPMMMINGTEDRFIQWDGGEIMSGGSAGVGGSVIPVPETARFWRSHNGCNVIPALETLPDVDPDDGTRVKVFSYAGCEDSSAFKLVAIDGGGHSWPGSHGRIPRFMRDKIGNITRDIDGNFFVWNFFSGYSLH